MQTSTITVSLDKSTLTKSLHGYSGAFLDFHIVSHSGGEPHRWSEELGDISFWPYLRSVRARCVNHCAMRASKATFHFIYYWIQNWLNSEFKRHNKIIRDAFLVDHIFLCHILSDILVEFKKIPSQCSAILWRAMSVTRASRTAHCASRSYWKSFKPCCNWLTHALVPLVL